jgi:coenzyme F420-reducing hydrogenase delta subunit
MTSATARILQEASNLPAKEKLELVDRLIAELGVPDLAVEQLWAEEAQKRSEAVKRGEMATKPLGQVLGKYSAQ